MVNARQTRFYVLPFPKYKFKNYPCISVKYSIRIVHKSWNKFRKTGIVIVKRFNQTVQLFNLSKGSPRMYVVGTEIIIYPCRRPNVFPCPPSVGA